MSKTTILCNKCGGPTFEKTGRVAIGNKKGEPSKYKRSICSAGCGWVGGTRLEDGGEFNLPGTEQEK